MLMASASVLHQLRHAGVDAHSDAIDTDFGEILVVVGGGISRRVL